MTLSLPRKIIFTVVVVAAFFGCLEFSLRLIGFSKRADDTRFVLNPEWDYPEYFLKDRELLWRLRPDQIITSGFFVEGEYHINQHGLRGPDFSPRKSPGTSRIICLGNSCTFGWRVGEHDVYSRQAEAMLNEMAPGRRCKVINAGVTGYSSLQGLRFLHREVLGWQPDLLIVSYGWNDHWPAARGIADDNQQLPPQWVLDMQNLLGGTLTYRWLKYLVFSVKNPPPADFSRMNPVYRVGPEDFQNNLRGIVAAARDRNVPVVLLTAPIADRAGQQYAGLYAFHEKYNEIIRSFGGIDGVAVLDAAAEFDGRTGLFDNPEEDLKHYNVNGHKLIARMIAEYATSLPTGN